MSDEHIHNVDDTQVLTLFDTIQKRPGMFIGSVNTKGFVGLLQAILKDTFLVTQSNKVSIELQNERAGRIQFDNVKRGIISTWVRTFINGLGPLSMGAVCLNALSSYLKMCGLDDTEKVTFEQVFEKGELVKGELEHKQLPCSTLILEFTLTTEIWKNITPWNVNYITHQLRNFAYLHKGIQFHLFYQVANQPCNVIYYFKNGLKDRLAIEQEKGLTESFFETYIDTTIGDFFIEIAFSFRGSSVDPPFLEAYVNNHYTHENGTHVDGLLKGLTYGVMKYFQKYKLTQAYKISEKGIQETLMAVLNIRIKTPSFSGCVKNKLANPEIIEPIANYIAELFFERLEKDTKAREDLIRRFRV